MNTKLILALGAGILTSSLAFSSAGADETEDRQAVISVIDTFFAGMKAKDTDSMREVMMENGLLYGYRETADGLSIFNPTHIAYLESLATRDGVPVERYWDPKVMLHDRLAVVWAPYDFYSDGAFSHCGVNNFNLLKTDEGWKITGVVFSMQTTDCAPSPLGPLQVDEQP